MSPCKKTVVFLFMTITLSHNFNANHIFPTDEITNFLKYIKLVINGTQDLVKYCILESNEVARQSELSNVMTVDMVCANALKLKIALENEQKKMIELCNLLTEVLREIYLEDNSPITIKINSTRNVTGAISKLQTELNSAIPRNEQVITMLQNVTNNSTLREIIVQMRKNHEILEKVLVTYLNDLANGLNIKLVDPSDILKRLAEDESSTIGYPQQNDELPACFLVDWNLQYVFNEIQTMEPIFQSATIKNEYQFE